MLDSFVTKTSESEQFDKNMLFEVPLQTDNLDKTRVVVPRGAEAEVEEVGEEEEEGEGAVEAAVNILYYSHFRNSITNH